MLDGAELVGDVEDGHAELGAELGEERRERLLRLRVDAGRRLVECEQGRFGREGARDERTLLHAAGQRPQRRVRAVTQADTFDRLPDGGAVDRVQAPE